MIKIRPKHILLLASAALAIVSRTHKKKGFFMARNYQDWGKDSNESDEDYQDRMDDWNDYSEFDDYND